MANAATPHAQSTSSSGMISGVPYVAAQAANTLNAQDLLTTAIAVGLETGRKALTQAIRDYPDWRQYENNVRMEWNDGGFEYILVGTEEEKEAIKLLEYGSPDAQPQSVLRVQALRMQGEVTDRITEELTKVVGLA